MPRSSRTSIESSRAFANRHVVGAITTTSSGIAARVSEVDNDLEVLSNAVDIETKRRTALYAGMIANGQCKGVTNPSTGYLDCWGQNDVDYSSFAKAFTSFKFDWSAYKAAGITVANSDEIALYANRLHSLRSTFESLTGKVIAIPETPKPNDAPSSVGSALQWGLLGAGALAVFLLVREK